MYLEPYLKCITSFYPSLEIHTIHWNHFGENNDILFLNNQWVFRFPKHDKALKSLQTECEQLTYVRPYITLPTPEPVFVNTDTNILGQAFFGYPLIPGEPLYAETLDGSSPPIQERIAQNLAQFLCELHAIPTKDAPGKTITNERAYDYWLKLYEKVRQSLFSYIRLDKQQQISRHFETFLNDRLNFEFTPAIIHGDFGISNILYDDEGKRISGIVDFGSSHVGDPAIDIAGLLKQYGQQFVDTLSEFYPNLENLLPRARFYAGTFGLQEALYGYQYKNQESLENGLKEYV
ncbi:phosphotransferase family protein [Bacillus sp. Marseille-Q3570]|uniref:phosphotransferase family protein n=1 Tax=Bacillus sp. Marseille-Q3570 TaxID=2963522 RepID=UPI0021B73004|nr:aminoglycoside phosphotransferase family protein [Bacillus sp. Marseille-Q3570]